MIDIVKELLYQLENKKVQYCHWKSNANLVKSVNGKTDLDILINQKGA